MAIGKRFAVIPTHSRPQDFEDCLRAIRRQVDHVFVVDHRSGYTGSMTIFTDKKITVLQYDRETPNISEMWNLGLTAAYAAAQECTVAVLNDDVVVPPDWYERVEAEMAATGAAAGCVRRDHDPRMTGYAFVLDSTYRLLADEQFQWWYGDDDLERRAAALGGVAFAPGRDVEHRHPNSTTVGQLAEIAAQDFARFGQKWGF